jgi:hypothetical protein
VARPINDALGNNADACEKVHQKFAKRIVDVEKQQGLNFCDSPRKLRVIYLLKRLSQDEYKVTMPSAKSKMLYAISAQYPWQKRQCYCYKAAC